MKRNKNKTAVFISSLLLGIVYLLSALGKYSGFEAFEMVVSKFGFPVLFAYAIISIEIILCICLLFQMLLRMASIVSFIFLISLTLLYSYGHFRLDIESCDCFGDLDFLNTSNFSIFFFKNLLLILLSAYIFKKSESYKSTWQKKIISVSIAGAIVFGSLKYNTYYFKKFSKNNIGKSVTGLGLNKSDVNAYDYYFVFSPNCHHCRNAIPVINSMIKKHEINIVGMIAGRMNDDLVQLKSDTKIDFKIVSVDDKVYKNLVRLVPVIYEIKNDTIINSYSPKFLPVNILSRKKINMATHLPF